MTNPAFNPDDPRLTAFALGELDGADRAEIEQLIAASPEAAAAVNAIEETIGVLNGELAAEPAPGLTAAQRTAILDGEPAAMSSPAEDDSPVAEPIATVAAAAMTGAVDADDLPHELMQAPSVRSFPWTIAGSLVASAAVMIAVVSWMPDGEFADMAATPAASEADQATEVAAVSGRGSGFEDQRDDCDGDPIQFADEAAESGGFAEGESFGGGGPGTNSESADRAPRSRDGQQLAQMRKQKDLLRDAGKPVATTAPGGGQPDPASRSTTRRLNAGEGGQAGASASGKPGDAKPGAAAKRVPFDGTKKESERPVALPGLAAPAAPSTEQPTGLPGRSNRNSGPRGGKPKTADDKNRGRFGSGASRRPGDGEAKEGQPLQVASIPGRPLGDRTEKLVQEPTGTTPADIRLGAVVPGNEAYEPIIENDFVEPVTKLKRLSTFSIDVDTASYSNVRRFLNLGQLPPPNAVRIEELVNYFRYDYAEPKDGKPFAVDVELNQCPWAAGHRLARIGIKARSIDKTKRPPTSLVFMIDVSGSMRASNKLALVKQSIGLLVEELTEDDQVSVVAYANNAGLRLDVTSAAKRQDIMKVVNGLTAGGSTNGEGGIRTAYDTAIKHFIQGGSNRVIMCTDGDFNVGVSKDDELVQLIEEKAASGVFLSIFGFGMGNLKDAKLEKLADKGNGHYGYMDNLREAQKVFRDDLMGTLYTVAKDVKIQVEFNPATVGAYRLIGYENRKLAARDFNDDMKDAGEIGAGHVVTALYEIVPKKTWDERPNVGELRYEKAKDADENKKEAEQLPFKDELLFVKLNYKNPDEETSTTNPGLQIPVLDPKVAGKAQPPSEDFMWAASVASFGMNLRGSKYRGSWTLVDVMETVEGAKGDDELRAEFAVLVKRAMSLIGPRPVLRRPPIPKGGLVPPAKLTPAQARLKASVNNKYRRLLKKIDVPNDLQSFGGFYEYGAWEGTSYAGNNGIPQGYWVYVYPSWYIWGVELQPAAKEAVPEQTDPGDSAPPEEPKPDSAAPAPPG